MSLCTATSATQEMPQYTVADGNTSSMSLFTSVMKRKFFNDEYSDSTEPSSAQNHCEKKRRLNNNMHISKTKILPKPTVHGYNVKYMAAMCYNAYATRRLKAGVQSLSKNDSQAFKGNLIAVFEELKSGKIDRHVDQALEIIPILARTSHAKCNTREQLVEKFIDVYHSIQVDLKMLDLLVADLRVNETFFDGLYKNVLSIHYNLDKAVVWHDILPYTDLSLIGLRKLRNRILGWNEYRSLTAALGSIDDIEYWLRLPPQRFEVPARMISIAMESLQEVAEERLRSLYEPSPNVPSITQLLAKIKKEDAEKGQAVEIERIQREQEFNHYAMEAQADAKRHQERADAAKIEFEKHEEKAKLAAEKKLQEAEEAKVRAVAEQKMQQEREAQAQAATDKKRLEQKNPEAKSLAEKRLLEEKEAEAKAAAKKKLRELREGTVSTRRANELEHRKFQDTLAAKDNEREQLRKKGEGNKKSAHEILAYLERESIPQNVLEMFHWPSKQESLAKLTDLWISNHQALRTAQPLQLLAQEDLLLELEYSIMTEVLSTLVILKARRCDANDALATGWNLDDLSRLQSLLRPYSDSSALSGLNYVIDAICKLLADFKMASQTKTATFIDSPAIQSISNAFFGSSMPAQTPQRFRSPSSHPFGSDTINPAPEPDTADGDMPDAKERHRTKTTKNMLVPKIRNPLPCKFAANGTCTLGKKCDYTHPWDELLEAPMETPCYHFFRKGSCRNGDFCHLSHDTARFGPQQVAKQLGLSQKNQNKVGRDASADEFIGGGHSVVGSTDIRSQFTKKVPQPQKAQKPEILPGLMNGGIDVSHGASALDASRSHNAKVQQPQHAQNPAGLFGSLDDIISARHRSSKPIDLRSQVPCRNGASCTRKNCAFEHVQPASAQHVPSLSTGQLIHTFFNPSMDLGTGSAESEKRQSSGRWNGGPGPTQGSNNATSTHGWLNLEGMGFTQSRTIHQSPF